MVGDMGRGSRDDSKTWHEYGAPGINVSMALGAEAQAGNIHAVFLFGDLSYAQGCVVYIAYSAGLSKNVCIQLNSQSVQHGNSSVGWLRREHSTVTVPSKT